VPTTARSLANRPLSLLSSVASPAEAQVLRTAARRAEDAGDFVGASRLAQKLPDDRSSRRWQCELAAARRIDPANRAALACWLVHPAVRWARDQPGGAILDQHALLMLRTIRMPVDDRERTLAVMASHDPVVVDAALFDADLFDGYLAGLTGSALIERVPGVERWTSQPVLVWEVLRIVGGGVELRDLSAGALRHARYWPDASPGTLVYGRLVPVLGDISLSFALPPVLVDQRCAARIVRARRQGSGPEENLRAVGHSRRRALESSPSIART
jgi:hypothetical protein